MSYEAGSPEFERVKDVADPLTADIPDDETEPRPRDAPEGGSPWEP